MREETSGVREELANFTADFFVLHLTLGKTLSIGVHLILAKIWTSAGVMTIFCVDFAPVVISNIYIIRDYFNSICAKGARIIFPCRRGAGLKPN